MADPAIGRRIAAFREAAGLSQAEASEAWGVSKRALEQWERLGPADAYAGLIGTLLSAVPHEQ